MRKIDVIINKNILWAKIKRLGEFYGEDMAVFIKEYAKDVYNANTEDLEGAVRCFSELVEQIKILESSTYGKNGR